MTMDDAVRFVNAHPGFPPHVPGRRLRVRAMPGWLRRAVFGGSRVHVLSVPAWIHRVMA
jgi:hypothetical protein